MRPALPPADVLAIVSAARGYDSDTPRLARQRRPRQGRARIRGAHVDLRALDEVSTLLGAGCSSERGVKKGDRVCARLGEHGHERHHVSRGCEGWRDVHAAQSGGDRCGPRVHAASFARESFVVAQPEDLERTRAIVDGLERRSPVRVIDLNELGLAGRMRQRSAHRSAGLRRARKGRRCRRSGRTIRRS